jgi:hypothetical protein
MRCPECRGLLVHNPAINRDSCLLCGWFQTTPEQPPGIVIDTRQADLFVKRNTHRDDPNTSKQAARLAFPQVKGRKAVILRVLERDGPLAVEQLAPLVKLEGAGGDSGSATGRILSQLHKAGLVRDSGERHTNVTGREAVRWAAVFLPTR